MILNAEKSYAETVEIYGGFPLKENFLDIGNAALAEFGVQAELTDDDVIRIPFVDRLLYTQDDLDELCDDEESMEDMKTWRVRAEACIELSDDPSIGVRDAYSEYRIITPWDIDFDDCFELTDEEYQQSIFLIETFLNTVIDCA